MVQVITVTNQKGGVGKTLLAFQVIHGLARAGFRVLAVDNDPQGNLTQNLLPADEDLAAHIMEIYKDSTPTPQAVVPGLDLIGCDIKLAPVAEQDFEVIFKLREGLDPYRESYDVIVIDSLPSFGHLHLAALAVTEYALIPAKPSKHAFSGLVDQFNAIEKAKKRLASPVKGAGIVLNLVDTKNVVLERNFEERLRQEYGGLVYSATLKKRIAYEESATVGSSILEYDRSQARSEFETFFAEFMTKVGRA